MKPVAITGIGVIGATGAGVAAMDDAISVGRSGLGSLSLWQSELAESCPVGEFKGDLREATEAALSRKLNTREIKRLSRSDLLTLAAAAEAVAGSGLSRDLLSAAGAGAYLGQSVCGTFDSETFYIETRAGRGPRNPAPLVVHEGAGSIDALAREFNLCGPSAAYMTACSSAANAIGMAAEVLNEGSAKVMLAGGGDSLSRIAFNGFCSLQVVSPDGPRPFDRDRQGMSVGEGAAILVLETIEHAKARGAEVLALLSGYGHSCDAYHLTAPHPEGEGASRAMGEALATAGISKGDVGYINAHGTATLDNDRTEALAIRNTFGEAPPPVSSTKRFFGHTLAAAGAIEAVVCVRALQQGLLPPNLGLREAEDKGLDLVREARQVSGLSHVLSNSFGFGGNNAALVFSAVRG